MFTTPIEYLNSLNSQGYEWLSEFMDYMRKSHSSIEPVMFRQRPMFKVGKSYVFFTVAKEHFTVHTLNLDLIESLKDKLPKASFGKGCVKVKFTDDTAKPILMELCDEIIRLNLMTDAPEVGIVPEQPYDQKLLGAFGGSKAKWLPLYEVFRDRAKISLPDFEEYFPAVNVLWKHTSTLTQVSAVTSALRIEFYSGAVHPERNPIKTLQTSKNRVAHTVEVTEESGLDDVIGWVIESYALTNLRR